MVDILELKRIFIEKLSKTGSLDEAFTKAVWIAYSRGVESGKEATAAPEMAGQSEMEF